MSAWLGRYQAWLFFPRLLLEGLHLRIAGIRALLGRSGKAGWAEAGLLAVHIGGYLTAVFVLSPLQAVVFLVAQQGLFGVYLGSSFAPNHYAQVPRHLHTSGRPAQNRLLIQPPRVQMRPLNRATRKTSCGLRRGQAHTGDNESLPCRAPASPGNQPVQRPRP